MRSVGEMMAHGVARSGTLGPQKVLAFKPSGVQVKLLPALSANELDV